MLDISNKVFELIFSTLNSIYKIMTSVICLVILLFSKKVAMRTHVTTM